MSSRPLPFTFAKAKKAQKLLLLSVSYIRRKKTTETFEHEKEIKVLWWTFRWQEVQRNGHRKFCFKIESANLWHGMASSGHN